jgi:hypothetical protein
MKAIKIEIIILIALVIAEWFEAINFLFALFISITILTVIFITAIIFLLRRKFKQFLYLFLVTIVVMTVTYLIGVEVPPYFRKRLVEESYSIIESKKNKAFVCQYEVLDTTTFHKYFISAKEIFAEKSHLHKGWYRRDFYYNDTISNLILVEDGNIVRGPVGGDWNVKKTALITFAGKRKQFIIFNVTIRDTLYIEIINEEKEVIDSLSFVRIEDRRDKSLVDLQFKH